MNQLKNFRISLDCISISCGLFCIFTFGLPKFASGKQDDLVFGIIILFILTINRLGLGTFGYYAMAD
jgi:hypothetical protein